MLGCAVIGWWVAVRVRLFGAAILGPMIAAIAASLFGLIHHRPPAEAILAAQFFIGLGIGAKYRGITLGEIRGVVLAALGFCAIMTAISAGFAELVVHSASPSRSRRSSPSRRAGRGRWWCWRSSPAPTSPSSSRITWCG